jgi:hypothetical protein
MPRNDSILSSSTICKQNLDPLDETTHQKNEAAASRGKPPH